MLHAWKTTRQPCVSKPTKRRCELMSDWSAGEPPRARRPHSEGKYDYYRAARGSARPARDRGQPPPRRGGNRPPQPPPPPARKRSEEHTSELQSREKL